MSNKNKQCLQILIGLMVLDTALTLWCVSLGAIELNPLCYDFTIFICMKVILSLVMCAIIYIYLLNEKCAHVMLIFLITWYGFFSISNILQYACWVIGI
jgi:hypothetical protein